MRSRAKHSVSLYWELLELGDALDGVLRVLETLQDVPWADRRGREGLAAGTSMVAFLVARVRLIGKAINGDVDPALLLTRQNVTIGRTAHGNAKELVLRTSPGTAPRPSPNPVRRSRPQRGPA